MLSLTRKLFLNYKMHLTKDFSSSMIYEESVEAYIPKGYSIIDKDYCKNGCETFNKSIRHYSFFVITIIIMPIQKVLVL